MTPSVHITHLKRAELLSSLGAGVLGAGVALLLANLLTPYAIPILLLGLISQQSPIRGVVRNPWEILRTR